MPRIKTKTATFSTRRDFEEAVDKVAILQLKLDHDIAEHNKRKAAEDKAFKTRVKTAQAKLNEIVAQCESYAAHHRDELLGEKKTAETKLAFFGYRQSPGIVKTLNSKWTLGKALEALKAAGHLACIKVTETLDKQAVKRQIPEAEMAQYGLRIDAPDEFGIEPKRAADLPPKKASVK
jgi:phage host-nuclease inhibitor protein Gam